LKDLGLLGPKTPAKSNRQWSEKEDDDMVVEGDVPLGVEKHIVKLAHVWVLPFIAPIVKQGF
jgi:hypothetical protein